MINTLGRWITMNDKVLLTKQWYDKLTRELEKLETIKRPQNAERVKRARSLCDFNHDLDYEEALDEQATINQLIKELQHTLRHAEIIKSQASPNSISLGTTIEIFDIKEEDIETYTIVTQEEADPSLGRISKNSPLGKALVNAQLDDTFHIDTPNGVRHIIVKSIK